ncbi:MAG: STAS/SEC14 domain-containing protein [Bacteroidetes bacterium]|nr:STAS/SEC14 domain-containing protein [Bacteroidota bacterium]
MITRIEYQLPDIVAFRASGTVSKEDYDNVVYPAVTELVHRTGRLNYIMVIDTPLHNFTIGAWWKDAILGLKELTKWHRVAILTDSEGVNQFTNIVSLLLPGEYKGFKTTQLTEAIEWVGKK